MASAAMSLKRSLVADVRIGATAAAGGAAAVAVGEWILVLAVGPPMIGVGSALRLAALDATLLGLLWLLLLGPWCVAAMIPRLVVALTRGRDAAIRAPRWWVAPSGWSPRAAPRAMAIAGVAALFVGGQTYLGWRLDGSFREPVLVALLVALSGLFGTGVAAIAALAIAAGLDRTRSAMARAAPRLARYTLGSPWWAFVVIAAAAAGVLLVIGRFQPHLRGVWPWRWLLSGWVFAVGAWATLELGARLRRRARRRGARLGIAVSAAVAVPATLLWLGADPAVKYQAIVGSPTLASAITLVRYANDLDRDGFGTLLGETDCGPRSAAIRPGARDVPDDGIDQNCDGRDFSMRDLVVEAGPTMPVPEAFRQPWNVLLITVDTMGYDHTTFGGYLAASGRDTTPRLAELVGRSTSFTFAQATSAGTVASVPAILTSKFFHSGIAIDEKVKPRMPPRIKPENVTLPEVMKRRGYRTGAILSHEYFNDWGLDQGVDEYDNEIGKTHDPWRVSADRVTDRALAWIGRHPNQKWFLWLHYLDPHSQYAEHPGEVSYGDTQKDRYDAEVHFTDRHIGRLIDELLHLPGGERTIVVLTSDHGDAFGQHGFDGHAVALFKELVHVPLIFYIPNNPPRLIGGAVSNLDIFPTVAALADIDISDLSLEGRSLIPQIFAGREDRERTVFAETNFPVPVRAAITAGWKLIYHLKNNVYELYDLSSDPFEKTNVASRAAAAMAKMKPLMTAWLERVVFTRDATMNNVAAKVGRILSREAPAPRSPVAGVAFHDGAIEVVGYDVPPLVAGAKIDVTVYLRTLKAPSRVFRFGVALWGVEAADQARTQGDERVRANPRITLDGLFPTDRWQSGDYIKEQFSIKVPVGWKSPLAGVGVTVTAEDGPPGWSEGVATVAGDPTTAVLGTIPMPAPVVLPASPRETSPVAAPIVPPVSPRGTSPVAAPVVPPVSPRGTSPVAAPVVPRGTSR